MRILLISFFVVSFIFSDLFSQYGWVAYQTGATNLNSIDFLNSSSGFAVGNGGKMLKSTNGGINWFEPIQGFFIYDMTDIKVLSNLTILMVHGNMILRSSDGGINWYNSYGVPSYSHLFNFSFTNSNTGYNFYDQYPHLVKTTNGGITWIDSTIRGTPGSYGPDYVYFTNSNTGWLSSGEVIDIWPNIHIENTVLLKTLNSGSNWTVVYRVSHVRNGQSALCFKNPDTGYWYNPDVHFVRTTNGGVNWFSTGVDTSLVINSIFFVDINIGWAVGSNGKILATSNGGVNWFFQQSGVSSDLRKVCFINQNTGWICSSDGNILKTTNGGNPIGITKISEETPKNFSLNQNYPNPFNPDTRIRISISKRSNITFQVFDVLGKLAATILENQVMGAGTYVIDFTVKDLPSGVYFYSLKADDFFDTKKMIILK